MTDEIIRARMCLLLIVINGFNKEVFIYRLLTLVGFNGSITQFIKVIIFREVTQLTNLL